MKIASRGGLPAAHYPPVTVFFDSRRVAGGGALSTRLVKSNGVNMLCCGREGNAFLIRLSSTRKVSPKSDAHWMGRLDETGVVIARNLSTGEERSFGRVRGSTPDPCVNLSLIARELGLDILALSNSACAVPTRNVLVHDVLATRDLNRPIRKLTYQELVSALGNVSFLDDLKVPDLSELEVELDDASRKAVAG